MIATAIIEVLTRALSADASWFDAQPARDGMPTIYVTPERLVETCHVLRDAPELRFVVLLDITAVDYHPREPRFEIVYILACPGVAGFGDRPKRLRSGARVGQDARLPTVSGVWASANWAEREVFDFWRAVRRSPRSAPDLMRRIGKGIRCARYPVQIAAGEDMRPLQMSRTSSRTWRRPAAGSGADATAQCWRNTSVVVVGRTLDRRSRCISGSRLDLTPVVHAAM
jgi:NADH-quinone oxidoreductase subunit C